MARTLSADGPCVPRSLAAASSVRVRALLSSAMRRTLWRLQDQMTPVPSSGDRSTCHDGRVFHHLTMRVSDRDASEQFLRTVLAPLGLGPTADDGEFLQFTDLSIAPARGDRPLTTGLHVGVVAPGREAVDAFW